MIVLQYFSLSQCVCKQNVRNVGVCCQLLMYTAKKLYFPGFPGFPGNRQSGNGIPGKYESGTYDNPNYSTDLVCICFPTQILNLQTGSYDTVGWSHSYFHISSQNYVISQLFPNWYILGVMIPRITPVRKLWHSGSTSCPDIKHLQGIRTPA